MKQPWWMWPVGLVVLGLIGMVGWVIYQLALSESLIDR